MVPWIGLACRREVQCDRVTAIGAFINKTHEDDFKVAAFKRDETPAPLSRPEFHPVIAEGQVTCLGRPKICPSTSWTFGPQIRVFTGLRFRLCFLSTTGDRTRLWRKGATGTTLDQSHSGVTELTELTLDQALETVQRMRVHEVSWREQMSPTMILRCCIPQDVLQLSLRKRNIVGRHNLFWEQVVPRRKPNAVCAVGVPRAAVQRWGLLWRGLQTDIIVSCRFSMTQPPAFFIGGKKSE